MHEIVGLEYSISSANSRPRALLLKKPPILYFVSLHPCWQRVFRGWRGRIFAQRWALKRAEIEALKSVLHEAAVNIQRAYRGHLGRVEASEVNEHHETLDIAEKQEKFST